MSGSLLTSMHISAAGMSAQRSRMDIVAENIANAESTRTNEGGPYRRRQVVFETISPRGNFINIFSSSLQSQQSQTVKVADVVIDNRPPQEMYDPSHPDANSEGMVKFPNVNTIEEIVDLNSASRGFESNVTVMQASKRMFLKTLELLR